MNITARLDMLINGAFANGQTDTFNALRLLRDDAARLEAALLDAKGVLRLYAGDESWHINSFTDGNSSDFDGWGPARRALERL